MLRPTNSNFNKRGPYTLFFPLKIVSVTISCNDSSDRGTHKKLMLARHCTVVRTMETISVTNRSI